MNLPFTKMQALGNDFVVFDFSAESRTLSPEQAAFIANRNFGIGCDQILVVESSSRADIDFKYRIYNADGSEVGQCGNGARCFARFVVENGLTDKNPIKVETLSGDMSLNLDDGGLVTVDMGQPNFAPSSLPFIADTQTNTYQVDLAGQSIEMSCVSVGNPHAVIQVDDIANANVELIGSALQIHSQFPERVNVGFMQINSRSDINLRVYERGAAETLSCGSGACAAVACGINNGLLDKLVTVHLPGGDLTIEWQAKAALFMTGPAHTVYTGNIEISN